MKFYKDMSSGFSENLSPIRLKEARNIGVFDENDLQMGFKIIKYFMSGTREIQTRDIIL